MADENCGETRPQTELIHLSDRQLMLHILARLDDLAELKAVLDEFRPLLATLRAFVPNGQPPDAITAAQLWRAGRRSRRGPG